MQFLQPLFAFSSNSLHPGSDLLRGLPLRIIPGLEDAPRLPHRCTKLLPAKPFASGFGKEGAAATFSNEAINLFDKIVREHYVRSHVPHIVPLGVGLVNLTYTPR